MKTMKNVLFTILSLLTLGLTSCKEDSIDLFDTSTHYLYILSDERSDKDSVFTSFKFYVGAQDHIVKFPVQLAGLPLTEDKKYKVEVVSQETTALPEDYSLDTEQIFHAGLWTDTLQIKLIRTAHLAQTDVTLTVRLVENENFKVGDLLEKDPEGSSTYSKGSLKATVTYNDKLTKPEWWKDDTEKLLLGTYSDIKYERFIEVTGVSDLSTKSEMEKRILVGQFKTELDKHNDPSAPDYAHWCEADGTKITVNYSGN